MSKTDYLEVSLDVKQLQNRLSKEISSILNFYRGFNERFYEILGANADLGLAQHAIEKNLSEIFLDLEVLNRIEAKLENLLEIKYQIKIKFSRQKPVKLATDLLEITNKFVKLCQTHSEFGKYKRNSFGFGQILEVINSIKDVSTSWSIFATRFELAAEFNEYLALEIDHSGTMMAVMIKFNMHEKNSRIDMLTLVNLCQLLGEVSALFCNIYENQEGINFKKIDIKQANSQIDGASIILQALIKKDWGLAFSNFLTRLLQSHISKADNKNVVVGIVGELMFFQGQNLKIPKKTLLLHQKAIQKSLKLLPKACFIEINAGEVLNLTEGNSFSSKQVDVLPEELVKSNKNTHRPFLENTSNEILTSALTSQHIQQGLDRDESESSGQAEIAKKEELLEKDSEAKAKANVNSNKEHVGFLTGG